MAFLGVLGSLASVAGGLLNGILGGGAGLQRVGGTYLEFEDGKRRRALVKYTIVHPDKSKVHKAVKLGSGQNTTSFDNGEVSFVLVQPDGETQTNYELHCFNNDPNTDYLLTLTQTNSEGNLGFAPSFVLNAANQPEYSNNVDLTAQYSSFKQGYYTVSPVEITSTPTNPGTFTRLGAALPLSTLMGNFALDTVAVPNGPNNITLYTSSAGAVTISWETDTNHQIVGYTIQNTTTYNVNASVTATWLNPAFSQTFNLAVSPSSTGSTALPDLGRPINGASCALSTTSTDSTTVAAILKDLNEAQKAAGVAPKVKSVYTSPAPATSSKLNGQFTKMNLF